MSMHIKTKGARPELDGLPKDGGYLLSHNAQYHRRERA